MRSDPKHIFAAVAGERVTIYECVEDGGIEVLQSYIDPDPEEQHYTCAWGYEPDTLHSILAFAGRNGVIRLIRYVPLILILMCTCARSLCRDTLDLISVHFVAVAALAA